MARTGRPTEYKEEYVDKVYEYLEECRVWWEEFHKTRGEKSDTYERIINVKLPMIEGFAEFLGVSKNVVYEWAKIHPDFKDALDDIRLKQHNMLAQYGVAGTLNPVITKLMLSNNHGYAEKSKTDLTSKGEKIKSNVIVVEHMDQ